MRITWREAKKKGREFFDAMSDKEFAELVIVDRCPKCEREIEVTPCGLNPRDHGHTCCACGASFGWISGADGCPFRG